MIIIPAVDIKNGKCVRLFQGDFGKETVFSDRPADMAIRWEREGAGRLHVVDLDGAVGRSPQNRSAVEDILKSISIPVQLGGGVRELSTIEAYLDLGINQVILGTAAQQNPALLKDACARFPGRIVAGIDARNGKVAVQGWTETTGDDPYELAARMEQAGAAAVIFTDINRDGMRTGPNIESTLRMCRTVKIPVICAGGVTRLDDIKALLPLASEGLAGAITGRAIYEGTLNLAEAAALLRGESGSV